MYQETTRSLTVSVRPEYLADQSNPREGHFVWAYHVSIENGGEITVQVLARHWQITDAMGRLQEVKGAGVVGEQPVLRPGERFEYTSGTPLATPSGIMAGTYQVETVDGERFDITIPAFSLDSPFSAGPVH
jgi:ApaG protein